MGKHSGQTVTIFDPISGKKLSFDPAYVPEPFDFVWLGVDGGIHAGIVVAVDSPSSAKSSCEVFSFKNRQSYTNCGYAPATPTNTRGHVFVQREEDADLVRSWPGYM